MALTKPELGIHGYTKNQRFLANPYFEGGRKHLFKKDKRPKVFNYFAFTGEKSK